MLFVLLLPGAKRTEKPRLNAFLKSAEQRANFLNITQTLTVWLLDLYLETVSVTGQITGLNWNIEGGPYHALTVSKK